MDAREEVLQSLKERVASAPEVEEPLVSLVEPEIRTGHNYVMRSVSSEQRYSRSDGPPDDDAGV